MLDTSLPCAEVKKRAESWTTIIGPMLSRGAGIGWTTIGHVGGDVALAVYHPSGDRPSGLIENIEVNQYMQRLFGVDLDALTARYYIEARKGFSARGRPYPRTGRRHRPLRVRKGRKSLMIRLTGTGYGFNGREMIMPTVTVYNGRISSSARRSEASGSLIGYTSKVEGHRSKVKS